MEETEKLTCIVREPLVSSVDRSTFHQADHTVRAFDALNALRRKGLLCDVILVADNDVELPAHRAVLAACSHYFYAMFTSKLSESRSDKVTLKQIEGPALELLVNFMYTSDIKIVEENVQILLPAANVLQLCEVRDACCEFLRSQLHPSNCLGINAFADLHACTDLIDYSQTYIEQHFSEVVKFDEFFNLTVEQVICLISDDRLLVSTEEQVFEAIISWIKYETSSGDSRSRYDLVPKLMEHVRLPLLSQDYLIQQVEEEPLIKNSAACKDYLIEAMKFHLLRPDQKLLYMTPRTKQRSPAGLPQMMLVIGGQAPKAIRSVECYDFKLEKWNHSADMPSRRCRSGVAVLGGLVYIVGGFNGSLRVRTVDVYDPVKDAWSSVTSMEARRSTLGASVLNGRIYAVGGFDGSSGLNSAEYYDPQTNEWHLVQSMSTRRSSVGVGVIAGLLYAVGGYDGASRHCLSSVECYDSETDTWKTIPDMTCRRSGAGVGVLDGLLYAVGGHDGPLVRKSVEYFSPESGVWTQTSDMHMCRRNAGVVSHGGQLFVVGGDDGSSNLSSVEYYNPKTDTWSVAASSLAVGRSYAGVCVIDRPI